MLREFDLQRMHWADKTQSMLHQRQMEACETRLLSYPTESIFTLQDERETECWWQCSYDAEESPKSPVLHTLREMRANVLARLPVEAALLTETEHALIVRLILCGGQARIDGWQELSAAESLLRRLWCTLEVDEQDVLLHLPRELMTPLSLTLREQRHQELRSRLLFFDTDTKAALAFPPLRKRAARFICERRSAGAALLEGGQRFLLQPRWGAVSAASRAG